MVLALLQDAGGIDTTVDMTMVAVLAVVALFALVVLGLRFMRALFEVVTAPAASLKYHGQNDHFFHSLMIVFLGGLIAAVVFILTQPDIAASWTSYSTTVARDLAAGNSNPNYRDVAETMALTRIDDNFEIYAMRNLLFAPMVFILAWLVFGTFAFLFAKAIGGQSAWVDMLGTTAYSTFFFAIGMAMAAPLLVGTIAAQVGGTSPSPGPLGIIGAILMLYGIVLFIIGVGQAADMTGGQTFGVMFFMAIILAGAFYGVNYQGAKRFAEFQTEVQSFNPAVNPL